MSWEYAALFPVFLMAPAVALAPAGACRILLPMHALAASSRFGKEVAKAVRNVHNTRG